MPTQLHELLAAERDVGRVASQRIAETENTFTKKTDHFKGYHKSLNYYDENREQENASEEKRVVTTVDEKLNHTEDAVSRLIDLHLRKEEANQRGVADLIVDGNVIGENLPGTFLLGLEREVSSLIDLVNTIPTLDPSVVWDMDVSEGPGYWRSEPITTKRTEKTPKFIVMVQPTKEHPAQTKEWNEDVPVANIVTTNFSGAWTVARKAYVLDRLTRLKVAVIKARQKANRVEINKGLSVGSAIFQYALE